MSGEWTGLVLCVCGRQRTHIAGLGYCTGCKESVCSCVIAPPALPAPPDSEALRLLRAGIEAFHFTREYIGEERLPEIEGWSWYDWCEQARAFLASGEREE